MRSRVHVLFVLAVVLLLGSCSVFTETTNTTAPAPERDRLVVGVGNAVETAPLRLAVADGLFQRGGLSVELVELKEGDDPVSVLTNGEVDVVFASNVALFRAAGKGAKIRLHGEAYVAGTGSMALVTLPDSAYTDPGQLEAPRIAVPSPNGLGSLTSRSVLEAAGVDPTKVTFPVIPFDGMVEALRTGRVDAAWLTEPHLTAAQTEHGVRLLADCAHGATESFPMSAYAATEKFSSANPRTLALFRELLAKAQQRGADSGAVRGELTHLGDIDDVTASLVSLGSYPQVVHAERLQRVADLMHGAGLLSERLDVASLVPKGELP
ncbi:ABC transporter substrate-binding protein [Saccharomonospora xinjiangensis]|uniref:ABC-type nitrate/sulfonate/bicarbonate transport system, periplasmic component n=1 Tax=Saccharomonospora xinjiangensis XJ-54 TaxID=882086 RepID=I0V432_9PSEU|nr:ABC transporter substrate-binding protein [Saccharomonospora xinjiangensis]EID54885.1 ABC-type nitrate/sulfonate/bicarbonate transport system, periplasmic component [Saccharomonospora xinjiangensis XJ-54]